MHRSHLRSLVNVAAALGLAMALSACTPAPSTSPEPPAPPPAPPASPPPGAAQPDKPAGVRTQNDSVLRELEAKLKPPAAAGAPAAPVAPTAGTNPGGTTQGTPEAAAAPVQDAELLLGKARELAVQLAGHLENGDAAAARALCAEGPALLGVLKPSFHDILGEGIPSQNAAAIQHLVKAMSGKKWKPEVVLGELARTAPQSPFVADQILLKKSVLRLESEGVRLEAHLEQLVLVDGEWKVFKVSAP